MSGNPPVFRPTRDRFSRFEKLFAFHKKFFEACGGNDFEQTRCFVRRIPKCMGHTAWFVNVRTRGRFRNFIPNANAYPSFNNIRNFIFHRVDVRRNQPFSFNRMLDYRNATSCLRAQYLEFDPDSPEIDFLAFFWVYNYKLPLLTHHLYLLLTKK